VIGTVKGDLHDIGKNLVTMLLKGANFGVIDLGTDVGTERLVQALRDSGARLVALSALLTTTMPAMQQAVAAIRSAGLGPVKIMVGGAPVTQKFADEIGADGYAPDAASAVDLARSLVAA
jgi:5-methyltetrahydrofolate--homocysteine methyltransferase